MSCDQVRHDPGNRDLVLKAAVKDPLALLHAVPELKVDREVVETAVRHHGDAILLSGLKSDKQIVLTAVSAHGDSLRYADPQMTSDREVVLAAVQEDGMALRYAADVVKDDEEVVMVAVRQTGRALRHASKRLRGHLGVVMAALNQDNAAYAYVLSELRETVYGLDMECRVVYQPLDKFGPEGKWQVLSKGYMKAFTIEGPTMYAVSTDDKIFKQLLVQMDPESDWSGPLSNLLWKISWIAIFNGFIFGVNEEDHRVYKQVLSQMSPETQWDGPVSNEMRLTSITIYDGMIYGVAEECKIFRQKTMTMCNISEWEGPLGATMDVKMIWFYGNKIYSVSTDNKIHWMLIIDLSPKAEWRSLSQGDVTSIGICNTDLKMACEEMLQVDWKAKGAHLDRRAAAAKAASGATGKWSATATTSPPASAPHGAAGGRGL